MQLEDFYDYKNKLMEDLLTSETIVSLIGRDKDIKDPRTLAYKQVFPTDYIPETVQDGQTFICFDVDILSVSNKTFLTPVLYIWIFVHRSKLVLPGGGIRADKLCSEVCKIINGSRYYGLGELNLSSVKRYAPMTDYQGKLMTFYAKEFNMQFNGSKTTPSNRKNFA